MLKRFIRWLFDIQDEPPAPLPEDPWLRMFALVDRVKDQTFGKLTIHHLDVSPGFYSDNVDQLYERLEMIIYNTQYEDAEYPTWKNRRREVWGICIPDYLYNDKHGYRSLDDVVGVVTEKIAIIHNLFETKQLDEHHVHYPYLRREYTSVVKDTCSLLEFALTLATPK